MAKLLCVFSTLAASVRYTDWRTGENQIPVEGDSVTIKGGAGVANEHIVTPRGVATMVTEAQAELLKRNTVFQLHEKNGFVALDTVERPPGESEVEAAVAALEGRDTSAPLVPEDYLLTGQPAPQVGDSAPAPVVAAAAPSHKR